MKRFALYLPAVALLLMGLVAWALFLLPASQAYTQRPLAPIVAMDREEADQEARLQRVRAEAIREVSKFTAQQRQSK